MRHRTVLLVETCLLAVGALALTAAWRDLAWSETAFGIAGVVAVALSVSACLRRGWARVPLAASCVLGVLLAFAAFAPDDPSEVAGFAHVGLSLLIVAAAGLSLAVTILEEELAKAR